MGKEKLKEQFLEKVSDFLSDLTEILKTLRI